MKSSDSGSGTPFSYAVPGADKELTVAKYDNFTVWVGDEKRYVSLLEWFPSVLCNKSCSIGFTLHTPRRRDCKINSVKVV